MGKFCFVEAWFLSIFCAGFLDIYGGSDLWVVGLQVLGNDGPEVTVLTWQVC